ncbi:MAG: hypothetical protein RL120_13025 [Gammaproteobacteria bacterium]
MQLHSKSLMKAMLGCLLAFTLTAEAQQPRFLSLSPPEGLPIIPVLEGWTANPDGTFSYSYGYINRNEVAIDIPVGPNNRIEPAEFNGDQPTHFEAGRGTGVFTVTVPANQSDIDVWWIVKTGTSAELKVPGRNGVSAYELDFIRPRPQGALQPLVGIGENGPQSAGLFAQMADRPGGNVRVGQQVEIAINATDPAERDPTDPRFDEPLDMNVNFVKHQGPGEVTFERHPDSVVPENPYDEDDPRFARFREPAPTQTVIENSSGVAKVLATFSAPGQYVIRATVDVNTAPDSSYGDQCCWTNVYQRVNVTP